MNLRGQRFGFQLGQALLIETAAASSADPPLRQIVHLVAAADRTRNLRPAVPHLR